MNDEDVQKMKALLRRAGVHPVEVTQEPARDLWPGMLERLGQNAARVPWWDWVLLAGAGLALWFFPGMLPALLYHL